MDRKKMTVRKAVFIPFIIAILLALMTFITIWRIDYNRLAEEQGSKILTILNENTQQKLIKLLDEPKNIANVYSKAMIFLNEFSDNDLSSLEAYTLNFMKAFRNELPQISVVMYADENKNFFGYRKNSNSDEYNLMLKDVRTNYSLNIYEGENINSEAVASYEGYDPTTRPFYYPVKESHINQWSDIYVNYDELNDATISILNPLFNSNGDFIGITGADVRLNGIHDFLKEEDSKENGVIYIVNEKFNIVAYSGDEATMKVVEVEGEDPQGEMLLAIESIDPLVKESASLLLNSTDNVKFVKFNINSEKHYALITEMIEPSGLNWRVISVMTEKDLMGGIKERQNITILIVVSVLLIGSVIGLFVLSRVTLPIRQCTEMAMNVANGNWGATVSNQKISIYETDELIESLNRMSVNLKESFEAVTINEARYRELVESLDEMIYSISTDGIILSVNKRFEEFFETTRDKICGISIYEFLDDIKEKDEWLSHYNNVLETKRKDTFQIRYYTAQDDEKILNVNIVPVLDEHDEIAVILASNSDITDLVLALENITKLKEQEKEKLEKLVKERTLELEVTMKELVNSEKLASLGSLVSGVSHEINTPLGVAVTTASYMEKINNENLRLVETNQITKSGFIKFMNNLNDSIKILSTNLFRASNLIKSFKMIAVNQSHENEEFFLVNNYIQATITSLKHELKHGHHTVDIECADNLNIKSYSGAISQILTNLIMNSIIHGFENKTEGLIKIIITQYDSGIQILYRDNGTGIPEENISKIFDPFYTSNRGKGGSGLGLNVVYNLVTGQLRGSIECESEIEEGTSFTIKIPLRSENIRI